MKSFDYRVKLYEADNLFKIISYASVGKAVKYFFDGFNSLHFAVFVKTLLTHGGT